jgi:3-oxoacyl-[acyl-carrier-protein] synthase-1
MSIDVAVLAAAVVTPIGLSLSETAASLRAGVKRFASCSWLDAAGHPFVVARTPLAPASTPSLPAIPRELGIERLLARPLTALTRGRGNMPLFLGLPDGVDDHVLRRAVASSPGISAITLISGGRAAGLQAVVAATRAIDSGACRLALAGAADSWIDTRLLAELDRDRRARSLRHRDGFTPGEAGALLLLGRTADAPTAPRLGANATGFEPGHLRSSEPGRDDGLAATVAALGCARAVRSVWSSLNGERVWAKEWAVAVMRHRELIGEDAVLHAPAEGCGDVGAASGPLQLALAAHALVTRRSADPALIYVSSDTGERVACMLDRRESA